MDSLNIEAGCAMQLDTKKVTPSRRRWIKVASLVGSLALVALLCYQVPSLSRAMPSRTSAAMRHAQSNADSNSGLVSVSDGQETDHLHEMKKAAEYAQLILDKASQAIGIYSQWSAVKLALGEGKVASEEAVKATTELGEKILKTGAMFVSSGLREFAAQLNNGMLELDMQVLEDMFDRTDENGQVEFQQAVESFRSCSLELQQIAVSCDAIINLVNAVESLTERVSAMTYAWVHVNMTMFQPLKVHAQTAKELLHGLVGTVEKHVQEVHVLVREHAEGLWNNTLESKNKIRQQVNEAFGDLGIEMDAFDTTFNYVIKPLVEALIVQVPVLVDTVQKYTLPLDAPENAADEEMPKSNCAWRNTRFFDAIDNVDIEKTMACDIFMYWYKCSCIGINDCYAGSEVRPHPANVKRCFKKV